MDIKLLYYLTLMMNIIHQSISLLNQMPIQNQSSTPHRLKHYDATALMLATDVARMGDTRNVII